MPRYVALLRGINVGGKNMIKMEKLRATAAALGLENATTYINSGNLAFDSEETHSDELAARLHNAIAAGFGLDISLMVRSAAEIIEIVAGNPYIGNFENDKDMHVFFLNKELSDEQLDLLLQQAGENESIAVSGRTIYYMLKISILDSVLGKGFLDKKLKILNTARNWRTTQKLAEL